MEDKLHVGRADSLFANGSDSWGDYRRIAGLMVPFRATATWQLQIGDLEYIRR